MGCDFFVSGRLPDIKTQEKVIEFVRQYDPMIGLVVQPDPKVKFRTLVELIGSEGKGKIENEYPFDFFGIIPYCKEVVLEHGQFIFDRTDGGRLIRFLKLPDSYHVPPQYPSYDKPNVELYISEGGYNRLVGSRDVFALLLNIIRLRWWPDLRLNDDFYVCRDVGQMLWDSGLISKMKNEALDFQGCLELFEGEFKRRHPPETPTTPKPKLRIVDMKTLEKPVADLELSICTSKCLSRAGVKTIHDLLKLSEAELLNIKHFGRKSLFEIKDILKELGLHFSNTAKLEEEKWF